MGSEGMREMFGRCMRNFGFDKVDSYVIDGCGEYVHDGERPGENKCKGCGCHRNFHQKVLVPVVSADDSAASGSGGGNPGDSADDSAAADPPTTVTGRPRTRFSEEQKQRMMQFAEGKGWKMGRTVAEHEAVTLFCHEIGISRQSFKVWMQNHKNNGLSTS